MGELREVRSEEERWEGRVTKGRRSVAVKGKRGERLGGMAELQCHLGLRGFKR